MPIGFQSLVDGTSIIQIDADKFSYQLVANGNITSTFQTGQYGLGYWYGTITSVGRVKPICLVPPGQKLYNVVFTAPDTYSFQIISTTTSQLEYAIFDIQNLPNTTNFGLKLYNISEEQTFNSNLLPLILIKSGTESSEGSTGITVPINKTYWYIGGGDKINTPDESILFNSELFEVTYAGILNNESSLLTFSYVPISTNTAPEPISQINTNAPYIIADVTNMPRSPSGQSYYNISTASSVNEGASLACTVSTVNVANNTTLYWKVQHGNTTSTDFPSVTGNFTVNSNSGTFSIPVGADFLTEGNQYFWVSISTSSTSLPIVAASNLIKINDTSLTATYNVSATTPVNEGSSSTVTVNTTNVPNGTTLYWTVLNGTTVNADFSTTSGNFTINSNTGSFTVPISADALTEGAQTFSVQVRTVSISGNVVATSNTVTINDTSITTFSASASTPVNEGSSCTVNVSASNIANGTTLYWTVLNGTTVNADFSTTSGSFTMNSNLGSFTVPISADALTEGSQTFSVQIRTDSISGTIVATSNTVTINDTSITTFSASASTPVNEGSSCTVNVSASNIANGTTLYWTVLNGTTVNADFSTTSGSFTMNSNLGSFTVPIVADATTEGLETFSVQIRTDSISGTIVATSNTVTINDTSAAVTYNAAATTPVNEGSSSTVTVNTTNVPNGTTLYWTVLNGTTVNADFSTTSGNFTINSNTGSFTVPISADALTEGAQTFSVQIRIGSTSGTIVSVSNTVTINDTSTSAPTYSVSAPSAVNEGSSCTVQVDTTDVASGTILYWTVLNGTTVNADFSATSGNFTITSNEGSFSVPITADALTEGSQTFSVQIRTGSISGTVVATSNTITINDTSLSPPTYAIASNVSSVNEGGSVTFTITTTNFGSGTLYWTTSGSVDSNDFTTAISGSVTITNDSGSIIRTLTNDLFTEGQESFAIQLRTGSTSGTIVATSSSVTIGDTSINPPTTFITLSNKTYNAESGGTASLLTVRFEEDGDIILTRGGSLSPGTFDEGDWISPKNDASSEYEIFVSQTNNGGTLTGTLNSWQTFNANYSWQYSALGLAGEYTATLNITIRNAFNPSITGSAVYTLNLNNLDG